MVAENGVSAAVLDAAIEVHRALGPGLLESVYEASLAHELSSRGHRVQRQVPVAAVFKGQRFGDAFRADLIVDDCVIIEVKAVDDLAEVHRRQVATYARLANVRLGLLINFGGVRLKDGFVRVANGMP